MKLATSKPILNSLPKFKSNSEIMPLVYWGCREVLFTPAYWRYQVELFVEKYKAIKHRLTNSLKAECVACLLGGHGIPAEIGLAAFEVIRDSRILDYAHASDADVYSVLSKPIMLANGKKIRYRFAKEKSKCISQLICNFAEPITHDCLAIRNQLTNYRGIGLKTASWIVRNWYSSDDVAILDIHIHRAGILAGFFNKSTSPSRQYHFLEKQFLEFANTHYLLFLLP